MTHTEELRARMNPKGLNLTDVIVGKPGGLELGMLRLYRRQSGAGKWSRLRCGLVLMVSGLGLVAAVWATLRVL